MYLGSPTLIGRYRPRIGAVVPAPHRPTLAYGTVSGRKDTGDKIASSSGPDDALRFYLQVTTRYTLWTWHHHTVLTRKPEYSTETLSHRPGGGFAWCKKTLRAKMPLHPIRPRLVVQAKQTT